MSAVWHCEFEYFLRKMVFTFDSEVINEIKKSCLGGVHFGSRTAQVFQFSQECEAHWKVRRTAASREFKRPCNTEVDRN
jgi:hypothetical protein